MFEISCDYPILTMKEFIYSLVTILLIYQQAEARRVVCYFPNWAGYREGDGKFSPNEFDTSKCTNVLYAFASLDSDSVTIKPSQPDVDIDSNYYKDIIQKSKDANAQPSLSLGGWSDSAGDKYSILFNDETKRQQFVENTVEFMGQYGFEGLDIDVEYPACPQGDCDGGNPNDKEGYSLLIKELSEQFKPKGWALSAAINSYSGVIDKAYDIDAMNQYFDWIGVMTYDYHSSAEQQTGPISPLRKSNDDKFPDLNTESTINYLINKGADKSKLLIGAPLYGYSYKLQDSSNNGYWVPTNGQGDAGPFTKTQGQLAYYEICDLLKNQGFTNVENDDLGAYAYKDNTWISYNSKQDIMNKVDYIKSTELGGIILWDASFDDFTGKFCGDGNNPLLSAIKDNID